MPARIEVNTVNGVTIGDGDTNTAKKVTIVSKDLIKTLTIRQYKYRWPRQSRTTMSTTVDGDATLSSPNFKIKGGSSEAASIITVAEGSILVKARLTPTQTP